MYARLGCASCRQTSRCQSSASSATSTVAASDTQAPDSSSWLGYVVAFLAGAFLVKSA